MEQEALRTNIAKLGKGLRTIAEAHAALKALLDDGEVMHMRTFLQRYSREWPSQFRGPKGPPLICFMRGRRITRLVAEEQGWFLASDGEYANPLTRVAYRAGNIFDLKRRGCPLGCVFEGQNPYFDSLRPTHSAQSG